MNRVQMAKAVAVVVGWSFAVAGNAHVTPTVVTGSDREIIQALAAGANKFSVREVTLTGAERGTIKQKYGWRAGEPFYRYYMGRDDSGKLVSAVMFMTDYTMHGPVRVAVGLDATGKVRDAKIVEVSEEVYHWVSQLMKGPFMQRYIGQDSSGDFRVAAQNTKTKEDMTLFYSQVVAGLIQQGVVLFDTTYLQREQKQ